MSLLIKNAHVVSAVSGFDSQLDIRVKDGIITEVGVDLSQADETMIDAKGLYAFPGLVDMHCHLREPGYEYKEDIESGSKSAAAGGFTSIACMPNTNPICDDATVVKYIKTVAAEKAVVNVYPIAAISKGLKGEQLTEVGFLKQAGAVAISDDGKPVKNAAFMKKAIKYSSEFGIPVISHCEDVDLVDGGVMNEGKTSTILGLRGISNSSEDLMIAREIILAEELGLHVHIAHVSTKSGVQLIREAKSRGVNITCETCPQYFSLTEQACEGFNTFAKINPPLRTQEDVNAIIEGLKDDTIDVIATDHAPHHIDEKNCEFNKAANGMIGFETALSLCITNLIKPGHLELAHLVDKITAMPADILLIDAGRIEVDGRADITLVDLNKKRLINTGNMLSKAKNTPFDGCELEGCVEYTICGGEIIYDKGEIVK